MEPVQLANIDRRAISVEELDFIELFDLSDRAAEFVRLDAHPRCRPAARAAMGPAPVAGAKPGIAELEALTS